MSPRPSNDGHRAYRVDATVRFETDRATAARINRDVRRVLAAYLNVGERNKAIHVTLSGDNAE